MAYGLRVQNTAGFIQIDQDYTNYYEIASTSFYLNAGSVYWDKQDGALSIPGYSARADDLIAINTGSQYNLGGLYTSGTTIYYNMWMQFAGTINVKVFRRMDTLTSANSQYGLEVYKSDGNTLAFSSNFKPMRVASVITGVAPFYGASSGHTDYTPYVTANTGYVLGSSDPPDGSFEGMTEWQTVGANSTTAYANTSEELGAYAPSSYVYGGTVAMLVIKG